MTLHETIMTDIQKAMTRLGDLAIISPTTIALEVQSKYTDGPIEPHIEYTSLEHLKQMCRKVLASKHEFDGEENEVHQGELFSGALQERYPIPHEPGGEPLYKRLELLTPAEIKWNVESLRKSARARLDHADALEAWAREFEPV